MKKIYILLLFFFAGTTLSAANLPDFTVSDIIAKHDNFIHIKLQNRSPFAADIKPELKEKIFLTIFINNIKRSEYKLKYMDKNLFKPNGTILFRTNFRMPKGATLKIKAKINPKKIIKETNFLNNTLEKRLQPNEHRK
ncbi:MAG: hypothetical protein GY950_25100 [bacterium]|nr:hypothetical protein [bacterium]